LSAFGRIEPLPDQVEIDGHGTVGIIMLETHEEGLLDNIDAQLFTQFPSECRDSFLAVSNFATGKFPQTGERMISGPFGNEHATIFVSQDAGGNANAA
jgi:hypothetical protein